MPVAPEQVIGRVAGKVAFVTGAARGIGRACAIRMAEEGADVALVDVAAQVDTVPYAGAQPKQLQSVANEIRNLGRKALEITADVRDGGALRGAADRTSRDLGGLDILVAAAGIDSWGAAWELTDEQWRTMIDVNLTGVWQSCKAVAPHMIRQARLHGWRDARRLVNLRPIVEHRVQRHRVDAVLEFLREGVRQPRDTAHVYPHREVLPLT